MGQEANHPVDALLLFGEARVDIQVQGGGNGEMAPQVIEEPVYLLVREDRDRPGGIDPGGVPDLVFDVRPGAGLLPEAKNHLQHQQGVFHGLGGIAPL